MLAVVLPFFHRFLTESCPHPMFNVMCMTILSIPCTLAISVLTTGWKSLVIRDPKVLMNIAITAIFQLCASYMTQYCYMISNLDAVVVFSLVPVLIEDSVNIIFREEIPCSKVFVALGTMVIGLLMIVANFGWSVEMATKDAQVMSLLLLSIFRCLQSISYRKLEVIAAEEEQVPSTIHTWVSTAALIPTVLMFGIFEGCSFAEIRKQWSSEIFMLVLFGVLVYEMYRICDELLPRIHGYGFATSFVGLACLPTLMISLKRYNYTEYTGGLFIGIMVLISGYVLYTFVTEKRPVVIIDSDGDTLSLLSNEGAGLDNENAFLRRSSEEEV